MSSLLIQKISSPVVKRFSGRKSTFKLFKEMDTGPEEWFRVEILEALKEVDSVKVIATNQEYEGHPGRPDFVINLRGNSEIVELKVLPVDRNYKTGYQRFCAGKTNKADFDALENGEVSVVIYVHWPSKCDFQDTKAKIEKRYSVTCSSETLIEYSGIEITISFWLRGCA